MSGHSLMYVNLNNINIVLCTNYFESDILAFC